MNSVSLACSSCVELEIQYFSFDVLNVAVLFVKLLKSRVNKSCAIQMIVAGMHKFQAPGRAGNYIFHGGA
jgi:hypothetical protein